MNSVLVFFVGPYTSHQPSSMPMRTFVSISLVLLIGVLTVYGCSRKEVVGLKVMSYNIRHGEGMDSVLDLSRAARVINSVKPDLCGLQEVDDFCTRTDSVGQTAYLSQNTGMASTFGRFMDFQGGEYGMATLTKTPIVSTDILELPEGKYEPRSSIVHEVAVAARCTIAFANVHFDWIDDEAGSTNRLQQAKKLVEFLDALNRPAIIIGDFNCVPDSPTMTFFAESGFRFFRKGADNLSFQGEEKAEIDHLIYRDAGNVEFREKSIELLEEPVVSDHRPLVAELGIAF